jgi:hypothetical protein
MAMLPIAGYILLLHPNELMPLIMTRRACYIVFAVLFLQLDIAAFKLLNAHAVP